MESQYHKYHQEHTFLAFSYNDNTIFFLDPNIGNNVYTINEQDFTIAIRSVYLFEVKEKKEQDYSKILNDSIVKIEQEYNLNCILTLKEMLDYPQSILDEFANYNPSEYHIVPFLLQLSNIGGRRKLYSTFLEYTVSKINGYNLSNIIENLKYCASKWYLYRSIILKSIVRGDFNNILIEKLKQRLDEIYDLEIVCLNDIKAINTSLNAKGEGDSF